MQIGVIFPKPYSDELLCLLQQRHIVSTVTAHRSLPTLRGGVSVTKYINRKKLCITTDI